MCSINGSFILFIIHVFFIIWWCKENKWLHLSICYVLIFWGKHRWPRYFEKAMQWKGFFVLYSYHRCNLLESINSWPIVLHTLSRDRALKSLKDRHIGYYFVVLWLEYNYLLGWVHNAFFFFLKLMWGFTFRNNLLLILLICYCLFVSVVVIHMFIFHWLISSFREPPFHLFFVLTHFRCRHFPCQL